jgi:diguanylate cyclase (GGDEF)-like protein
MAYFDQLLAGNIDDEYIQNRVRVGVAHQHAGLCPEWYLGAYNKYISLLLPIIWRSQKQDSQKALETTVALLKMVNFDMGISISTYIDAERQATISKSKQLEALNQVAIAITSSLGLQEVMEKIMHYGIELTGSKAACIAFYDEESKSFTDWVTQGLSNHFVQNMVFRPGGLASEAFTSGELIVSNDRTETVYKLSALAHEEGITGLICLPLICNSHHLGLLYLYRNSGDVYSSEEIDLLITFSHLAAGSLENARLHMKTVDMANTDALTGLSNRRLFDEILTAEIHRSLRSSSSFCLLMLDIDNFKEVNDTYGHLSGDAVLKQIANILRGNIRNIDTIARFGGEEFVIIAPASDLNGSKLEGERIRHAISDYYFKLPDGNEIRVTVSIGIACYPFDADDAKMLVDRADSAIYLAKRKGKNLTCLYSDE